MKFKVKTLYQNGRRLDTKRLVAVSGRLDIQRTIGEAVLFGLESNVFQVLPLRNVVLVTIAGDGLLLRGVEDSISGRETAQEWWCEPI